MASNHRRNRIREGPIVKVARNALLTLGRGHSFSVGGGGWHFLSGEQALSTGWCTMFCWGRIPEFYVTKFAPHWSPHLIARVKLTFDGSAVEVFAAEVAATRQGTQGQIDGFFSQLPFKCYLICGRLT